MAQVLYDREREGGSLLKSRVGWGAIFAGVVVAMVAQAVFAMLGMAIGFAAINPTDPNFNPGAIGMSSLAWLLVTALISAFVGGWVATSLANVNTRFDGMLHGILSWGLFMVVAFSLLGSGLGTILGGTFNLASGVLTGASTGVANNVAGRQSGVAAVREQVQSMTGMGQQNSAERAQIERQTERAANTASKAAWGAFLISLLSLVASAVGGVLGLKNHNTIIRTTA
jgi:hypothetical protein